MLRTVIAIAAAALAQHAMAQAPTISAPALAATEATLDFCARVDPKSAPQYWDQGKSLVQGLDAKAAAEIRNSDEYRQAYDSTAQMLARTAPDEAVRACNGTVAANR
jgi:HPt (histidine-containing phosphotransfer) domain-containing protein